MRCSVLMSVDPYEVSIWPVHAIWNWPARTIGWGHYDIIVLSHTITMPIGIYVVSIWVSLCYIEQAIKYYWIGPLWFNNHEPYSYHIYGPIGTQHMGWYEPYRNGQWVLLDGTSPCYTAWQMLYCRSWPCHIFTIMAYTLPWAVHNPQWAHLYAMYGLGCLNLVLARTIHIGLAIL